MTTQDSRRGKLFVVVAYDIPDDLRRARLHKKLKCFGTAVQYSVFEAILDPPTLTKMKRMIRKEVGEEGSVRLYSLCRQCQCRIVAINGTVTQDPQTIVV